MQNGGTTTDGRLFRDCGNEEETEENQYILTGASRSNAYTVQVDNINV